MGQIADLSYTLIFLEAHLASSTRSKTCLPCSVTVPCCLAREMTKLYEELRRPSAARWNISNHREPHGEFTLVVGGRSWGQASMVGRKLSAMNAN